MCQFDRCGCKPVQSGRNGPQVHVVVDRRVRPWVGTERTEPDEAWLDLTVPADAVTGRPMSSITA
jgi:hypothetical protein